MNANPFIAEPDLRSLLVAHRTEIFSSLNVAKIGKVVSFDPDSVTATIEIASKAVVFNQTQALNGKLQQTPVLIDYPVLADVPVYFPQGAGGVLTFPVAAGDECLVVFADRDMDAWFATGSTLQPNSPRMHSLSDAIAFVGIRSLSRPITDLSATDVELRFADSKVAIKADGTVELSRADSLVQIAPDGKVTLDGSSSTVSVKNGTGTLKTALDALFTALTTWVNTGGSTPNPATVAAINAAKAEVDAILS